jgi:DNA polymerase III subunit beta
MKYNNTVKAFRDAYRIVSRVIPSKPSKPILSNAKLRVTDAGAELSATDLDRGIRHPIAGGQVIRPGSCLLPGEVTGKILGSADDDTLTIETDGPMVKVSCGKARWSVSTDDATLFPEVPELTGEVQVTLAPADLITLVERTRYATDTESTRYALGGMLVEAEAEVVRFTATDGRRVSIQEFQADVFGVIPKNAVISVPIADLIATVAKAVDDLAAIRIDDRSVQVRIGGSTLYGRLVEGRFPAYRDTFPEGVTRRIAGIDTGAFGQALEQVKATEDDTSRGVDFDFSPGLLKMTHSSEKGSSEVEFPIDYDGPDVPITFDPRYVADVVKCLAGHEITIEVIDHKNAVVVRTDCGFTSVIMPLTRDR